MSAYVVDSETINKIVSFLNFSNEYVYWDHTYLFRKLGYNIPYIVDDYERLANDLFQMNVNAVKQRYSGDTEEYTYQFRTSINVRPAVEVYKAAQCLCYQCSEGNVPDTSLYKALNQFCSDLAEVIIANMPEYQAAYWG
jgi:hypothetical protein